MRTQIPVVVIVINFSPEVKLPPDTFLMDIVPSSPSQSVSEVSPPFYQTFDPAEVGR